MVALLPLVVAVSCFPFLHFCSFAATDDQPPISPSTVGHAGAVISGGKGKAEDKVAALEKAGVIMVDSPAKLGGALKEVSHTLSILILSVIS